MAITFHCRHCGKSLTTGEEKAGLTAKCPGCGQVVTVPAYSEDAMTARDDQELEPEEATAGSAGLSSRPEMRTCPMCGAENSSAARRCQACGEPLAEPRSRSGEPKSLELGRTMSLAWDIFKENLPVPVGAVFITSTCAVVWVYGTVTSIFSLIAGIDQNKEVLLVLSAVAGVFAVASFLILAFIGPGYAKVLLNAVRGEEVSFGMLFSGGRFVLRNLGASVVFIVAILIGSMICVIPGVIVMLMWWAYQFILIDEDTPALTSLSRSKELMDGRWADVFLIGLIAVILNFAVSTACCVAGVFSQAYLGILMAVTYVKLKGESTAVERPSSRREKDGDVDAEMGDQED